MANDELKIYEDQSGDKPLTRDDVRNILLAEFKNFRSDIIGSWGGVGNSAGVTGGNLYGFFAKQGHGSFYQSPHALKTAQTPVAGNDFARIFVNDSNDPSTGTPSSLFDLPQFSQKLAVVSQGPGLVYESKTASFTEGEKITGGTTGATAMVSAVFSATSPANTGTLYLYSIIGNFNDGEAITGSLGGAAAITRMTVVGGNPADPNTFGLPRINAIERFYGVGGEDVDTGKVYAFWGAINDYAPHGFFTMPASVAGTARDVENIEAFKQEGFTYVRLGTPNALRIYLNAAWSTIV